MQALGSNARKILTLVAVSLLLFMLGNHVVSLTHPDEVFYAGTAKEMLERKTWLVPYLFDQPQFEKPILTYWLVQAAFTVFGVTAFAARFFPALFALIGVLALYFFCVRVFNDRKKAFLCAFVLMSSGLYVGLARTVFTDLIFSVFIGLSLGAFYLGYQDKRWKTPGILLFFVFSALALLTKGLLGFTMPAGTVVLFLLLRGGFSFFWCRATILGVLLFCVIALPWYIFIIMKYGNAFIQEFVNNDHLRRLVQAEHEENDHWYFYLVTTLGCFFPWTLFIFGAFGRLLAKLRIKDTSPLYVFLACWIVEVFLQVQFAHSKLVSYIFPLYPAIAILTGDYLRTLWLTSVARARMLALVTLGLFLLLPPAVMIAAHKFPAYFLYPGQVYMVMAVFCSVVLIELVLVRRKLMFFPYAAAFNLFFVLCAIFAFAPWADDFVAVKNASQYLTEQYTGKNPILCSKMLLRGVRYYTGKEVVVLKFGGGEFFSPHPVYFIDSKKQLEAYLSHHGLVYGVFETKEVVRVQEELKGRYNCQVLKQFGTASVVKIAF